MLDFSWRYFLEIYIRDKFIYQFYQEKSNTRYTQKYNLLKIPNRQPQINIKFIIFYLNFYQKSNDLNSKNL